MIEFIIDLHKNSERQGPGSPEETLRALDLTGLIGQEGIQVADIGCGSGSQTLTLAQHLNGQITAIDLFPAFLEQLDQRSAALGLSEKISTLEASMEALPLEKESLDLIWSEGAIYNMGFEKGIREWKSFLKPGGYIAISEITWITPARPRAIEDFWNAEYPEIDLASNKIKLLEENGYILTGYFCLSENSWIDHYYRPMEAGFPDFLNRHGHSEIAQEVVREYQEEIQLYQRYKAYYNYGFYVAQLPQR